MAYVPQPGHISLRDKILPTEYLFSAVQSTTRGQELRENRDHLKDISSWAVSRGWAKEEALEIKNRLDDRSLKYGDLWEEGGGSAQAKGNVVMKRAGHDAWGVKKIPLVMSDDFMNKVYVCPWYEEWADLIEPILARFDPPVKKEQLIRCLFASTSNSTQNKRLQASFVLSK